MELPKIKPKKPNFTKLVEISERAKKEEERIDAQCKRCRCADCEYLRDIIKRHLEIE